MRDLHKVQERRGVTLMTSQVYVLLGLMAVVMGLSFVLGYYLGRKAFGPVAHGPVPLIAPDVENESVALLLARVAEEEALDNETAEVELLFHDLLPSRTGELDGANSIAVDEVKTAVGPRKVVASDKAGEKARVEAKKQVSKIAPKVTSAPEALKKGLESRASDSDTEGTAVLVDPASTVKETTPSIDRASRAVVKSAQSNQVDPKRVRRKTTTGAREYTVQVSSHQEPEIAEKLVRQLGAQGFDAYRVAAEVNGHTWYRVRVGSFKGRDGAEKELLRLKAARSELNPMITHR